jgi:hypothetical protein
MESPDHPLLSQAAALLCTLLTHFLPKSCPLAEIETALHYLSQEVARRAAEQFVQSQTAPGEQAAPLCSCGTRMLAEQRRLRAVLLLFGLIRFRLQRYRCPACGAWRCPVAEQLDLAPHQRMTRTLEEIVTHFGLSWSYAVAALLLGRVLPVAAVSAKTVERATKRCAQKRQEPEDAEAAECQQLPAEFGERKRRPNPRGKALPQFLRPERVFIGLDGILVRARTAKNWIEVQVGSMWSAWRELPERKHPRREILDRTVVARAELWDKFGEQVWRLFVGRGGLQGARPEVIVLGDGASGIRSLWELWFPWCRALLDPWHLWEKVKQRAKEVLGHRERALAAAEWVYERLKHGAVEEAREGVELWPAATAWAQERRDKLLAYLARNADIIGNYEALRASGYMTGSGLTEKANDLVVAPRMKNGKMHWSRRGANAVALLRAHVLNNPYAPLLPP